MVRWHQLVNAIKFISL